MLIKESEKSASLQPQLNIYKEGPGQSCVYSPLSDVNTVTSGQLTSTLSLCQSYTFGSSSKQRKVEDYTIQLYYLFSFEHLFKIQP